MQRLDGRTILSASDLNDFLACEHLTALELDVAAGALLRPPARSGQAEILARLGDLHEERYVERLRTAGVRVFEIERRRADAGERLASLQAQAAQTIDAMRAGEAAIYQATFFDGRWLGYADVLRRIEEPSELGAWSYEVEDAKLARSSKPYFLVQLCFYSECVAAIQGRMPERMHVVLGDGRVETFRVGEFVAYERDVRRRLEERVASALAGEAPSTYPYPVQHCRVCVWDARCSAQRVRDDSLSQVAGLTRLQGRRLVASGIGTLEALGAADAAQRPAEIKAPTFEKLARQARLQAEQRAAQRAGDANPYRFELLGPDPEATGARGFHLLRRPAPGDVFFDMEGDPYYDVAEGLEYLFGAYTRDGGFRAFWGCDRSASGPWRDRLAEKRAFEAFVDFVMTRRAADPGMHVYHYADYERRALQSLAQRHATREDEIDTLLREERLVDLYRVVRQSIVVGQPGYGLKKLEAFFGGRAKAAIAAGDESVVQFEQWRAGRDGGIVLERDRILTDIERYNEQDCVSTANLLEWLLERRNDASTAFGLEIPFYAGIAPEQDEKDRVDAHEELKKRLAAAVPADFDPDEAQSQADDAWPFWLAGHLLEYHWREEKPEWWAFYDRCERYRDDPEELRDDGVAVIGLEREGAPERVGRSHVHPFRFPAQEFKFDGGDAYDPQTEKKTGRVIEVGVRNGGGLLRLKRGPTLDDAPMPAAVVIRDYVPSKLLVASLARFAQELLDAGPAHGRFHAAYDLLVAGAPRFRTRAPGAVVQPGVVDPGALVSLIQDLDDSYLFVQGPPGSGKTYHAAHAIVALLRDGYRVGLTAFSHKAINNALLAVEEAALSRGVPYAGQRKAKEDDAYVPPPGRPTLIENVTDFRLGDGTLFAGTVWAFSPQSMDQRLDVLFVDEAGQLALPNAIAAALSARSVVLLGDPLQLPHVHHTSHPGGIGASVLEHLLGGALRPVPPDRGVLLDRTWRMHEDVCRFISDLMYEGRLHPVPACNAQRVDSPGLRGTGLRYLAVEHTDARVRSEDEARRIADEIELLLDGTVTDSSGVSRGLTPCDIIVVTPYNAQRRCIEAELRARGGGCEGVAVGTVDKFQGQEAYVVFFSTANSSPDDAPRGVEFIFDRNRLNVAISRARALAVYVGSPTLLRAVASSIDRMRALSAGCSLRDYGVVSAGPQGEYSGARSAR